MLLNPKAYIYDLAIEKESRNLSNFLNLLRALVAECRAKDFKALSMHTRTSEGLSAILKKRYGAKLLRTFDDWQGWGKFEYLELDLAAL